MYLMHPYIKNHLPTLQLIIIGDTIDISVYQVPNLALCTLKMLREPGDEDIDH